LSLQEIKKEVHIEKTYDNNLVYLVVQSLGGNQRNNSRSPAPVKTKPGAVKLAPISTGQKSLHQNPMSTVQSPPSKRTLQDQQSQQSLSPERNQYTMRTDQSPMRTDQSPMRNDSSVSPTRGGRGIYL